MTLWKIKNYKRIISLSILVKTIEKRVIKEAIQTEAWPNLKIEDRKTNRKAKKNKAEVDQKN